MMSMKMTMMNCDKHYDEHIDEIVWILEEYQNHFIRHLPILSVTCPSHPSLAHLIRHLPISSVTRHLSVEKKGFIG